MNRRTFMRAIDAMRTADGIFESKGKNRIHAGFLKHDKNTSFLSVGGHPVFFLFWDEKEVEFSTMSFSKASISEAETKIAASAVREMFGILGIPAGVYEEEGGIRISSDNPEFGMSGSLGKRLPISEFHEICSALHTAPKTARTKQTTP